MPRQASTGGKQRLGKTSKMGQRDIRRLLITVAMAVIVGRCAMARRTIPGWRAFWQSGKFSSPAPGHP